MSLQCTTDSYGLKEEEKLLLLVMMTGLLRTFA